MQHCQDAALGQRWAKAVGTRAGREPPPHQAREGALPASPPFCLSPNTNSVPGLSVRPHKRQRHGGFVSHGGTRLSARQGGSPTRRFAESDWRHEATGWGRGQAGRAQPLLLNVLLLQPPCSPQRLLCKDGKGPEQKRGEAFPSLLLLEV